MMNVNIFGIEEQIIKLFDLYERNGGSQYVGEPVTILEHSVQTAQLAQQEGYEMEVVLAAFFHDIGHLLPRQLDENMNGFGHISHEKVGAEYLRNMGFSDMVCNLIQNHVQAKRFLTFHYPDYYERLSEASKETLKFQGGKMNLEEAREFQDDTLFELSLKMREWDEAAKLSNQPLPDLHTYKLMAYEHLHHSVMVELTR